MLTHPTPAVIAISLAAFVLTGCSKPTQTAPTVEVQATPEPTPAIAATATPAPQKPASVPTATPAPATPEPNYFAPEGVYFLTSTASVETPDGIVGLRPGTRAVLQPDGRYLANGQLFELRADQLTNDLRVARQVAAADQTAQAAIRQYLQVAPASTAPPPPTTPQPVQRRVAMSPSNTPAFVSGTSRQSTGVQSSSALGSGHTLASEGHQWQKSPDGQWWIPIKRLDGKTMYPPPPRKRVQ